MDDFNSIQNFYNWIVVALEDEIFKSIHDYMIAAVQCHDAMKLQELFNFVRKLEMEME